MAILNSDVKLLKSERLTDYDDGGGRMTSNEIVNNEVNNLFPDISHLDRVYGRVSMRKAFGGVITDTTDTYYGAHVIVTDPPADPNVFVTMFQTASWSDERLAAKDFVERYLIKGGRWHGHLWSKHLTGQRSITFFQDPRLELPAVGQVFVLSQTINSVLCEQYVRVIRQQDKIQEFLDASAGKFTLRIITCELSDALLYDFEGSEVTPFIDTAIKNSKVTPLRTVTANASKYYGVSKLQAVASAGQLKARVESIFSNLVPSARAETPMVDMTAFGENVPLIRSSDNVSFQYSSALSPSVNLFVGSAILPGTLTIVQGSTTLTDRGGNLMSGETAVGTVNYPRGLVSISAGGPSYSSVKTVTFQCATSGTRTMETACIEVTESSRGYAWVLTLDPMPTPGSLAVSYMAQGNWYDLFEQGNGVLSGSDSAFGTGTLNFQTGSVIITTGALPDVDTVIFFSWATATGYYNRSNVTPPAPALKFIHPFVSEAAQPGTFSFKWRKPDGTLVTSTDNPDGTINDSNATGFVNYVTGEVTLRPTTVPITAPIVEVTCQKGPALKSDFTAPFRNPQGLISVSLGAGSALQPNSVWVLHNGDIIDYPAITNQPLELILDPPRRDPWRQLRDDGNGKLYNVTDPTKAQVGTVDYNNRTVTFDDKYTTQVPIVKYKSVQIGTQNGVPVWRNMFDGWEYKTAPVEMPLAEAGKVSVTYRTQATAAGDPVQVTVQEYTFDLTDMYAEEICSGSVRFKFSGMDYVDNGGRIYTNLDFVNGGGEQVGTIDYTSGQVTFKKWSQTTGTLPGFQLLSLLTQIPGHSVDQMVWRIPIAPVRPASLQIMATPLTGGSNRIDADADSYFRDTHFDGQIDYKTGIVRVRFGEWVDVDSSVLSQPWYNPNAVQNGKIFKPKPVKAETVRYNAIGYTYMPMNAEILGLDPVRLPADGRVPIFTVGDVVVVHNSKTDNIASLTTGQVVTLSRSDIQYAALFDSTDRPLYVDDYTVDLELGKVTIKPTANLASFVPPYYCLHRVEEEALLSDVQINGDLSFARPLVRTFDTDSHVSSALIFRDLQSRVEKVFAQNSWDGTWADVVRTGSPAAQYNNLVYPITTTNRGAVKERWRVVFTGTSTFNIIGESYGQIVTGASTASDCQPINPATGVPFFIIRKEGWGAGWVSGNVLRFNTLASMAPFWVVRTTLQGPPVALNDRFRLQLRGDAD